MKPSIYLKSIITKRRIRLLIFLPIILVFILLLLQFTYYSTQLISSKTKITSLSVSESNLKKKLAKVEKDLLDLKNQDQYKRNEELQANIQKIETTYKNTIEKYNQI